MADRFSPPARTAQILSTLTRLEVPECPGVEGGLVLPGGEATTVPASCIGFLLGFPGVVRLADDQVVAPDPVTEPAAALPKLSAPVADPLSPTAPSEV